jgi:hypothetical protein
MIQQPFGEQLVAGDTWAWTGIDLSGLGYAPPTYTLKYAFRGTQSLDLTGVASASGAGYDVTATGSQTAALDAGTYAWSLAVFDASNNRTEIARGAITIVANIFAENADNAGVDPRSWVKQALDSVRAVIQNRATRIDSEYTIAGRMLRTLLPEQLMALEGDLAERYDQELRSSGQKQGSSNQIHVSFGRIC